VGPNSQQLPSSSPSSVMLAGLLREDEQQMKGGDT